MWQLWFGVVVEGLGTDSISAINRIDGAAWRNTHERQDSPAVHHPVASRANGDRHRAQIGSNPVAADPFVVGK